MTLRQAQDRPDDKDAPLETVWQGTYISALKRGRWAYVSRTGSTNAVVILAEHDGKVILIEQYRVPVGGICLELPAGLVGDEDEHATVEDTAVKELEEETGFTCDRVERLGDGEVHREHAQDGDAAQAVQRGQVHAGVQARGGRARVGQKSYRVRLKTMRPPGGRPHRFESRRRSFDG